MTVAPDKRPPASPAPAGFWRRYLAYSLDWLLLAPILFLLLAPPAREAWAALRSLHALMQEWLLAGPGALPSPMGLAQAALRNAPLLASVDATLDRLSLAATTAILLATGTAAIYFIGFEASAWQATPGKRLLGLRVLDLHGQRPGWRRAGLRFLAGGLTWLSLNLGHALAGWRADGRALHDLVAGTRVVASTPTPRWARWLLYAQLALLLGVIAALLGRLLWLLAQVQRAGLL